MTESFTDLMRRAWEIFRAHRTLWILAFLAALGGRFGGGFNFNSNFPSNTGSTSEPELPPWLRDANPDRVLETIIPLLLCLGIGTVVLVIGLWVLGWWAQGGLIVVADSADRATPRAAQPISSYDPTQPYVPPTPAPAVVGPTMRFGAAWRAGRSRLGTLLGADLLLAVPVLVILLVMACVFFVSIQSMINSTSQGSGNLDPMPFITALFGLLFCLIPFIFIIALYQLAVSLLMQFGARAIVLENLGVRDGIRRGWALLRAEWKRAAAIFVIGLVINFAFGLLLLIPSFIVFGGLLVSISTMSLNTVLVLGVLIAASFWLFSVAWQTFVGGYLSVLWTLVYNRSPLVASAPAAPPYGNPAVY